MSHAVALLAGVVAGVTVIGTAGAHQAASPTLQQYSIAASALVPDGLDDVTHDYFNQWDPSALSDTEGARCFNTGLDIPGGATLVSAVFHYTAGANSTMSMEISQQDLANHTSTTLASFDSATTGTIPTYTKTTKRLTGTVTYSKYAYSLGVCPNGDATFSGVTINYTG